MHDNNMEASCFHGQPLIALQLGMGEDLGEERTWLLLPWHPRSTVVHNPSCKCHVSLVSAGCTREDRHFPLFHLSCCFSGGKRRLPRHCFSSPFWLARCVSELLLITGGVAACLLPSGRAAPKLLASCHFSVGAHGVLRTWRKSDQ